MPDETSIRINPYTRSLHISRLSRLVRMRRDYREDLNPSGLKLIDRAIYATVKECEWLGAAGVAAGMTVDLTLLEPGDKE